MGMNMRMNEMMMSMNMNEMMSMMKDMMEGDMMNMTEMK